MPPEAAVYFEPSDLVDWIVDDERPPPAQKDFATRFSKRDQLTSSNSSLPTLQHLGQLYPKEA